MFGEEINSPPISSLTSNCSLFTEPALSKTSWAAEITLRAPIAHGSSSTSAIPNAACGAFIARIVLANQIISSLLRPPTSAILVGREYPAKSITAIILPLAYLAGPQESVLV